MTRADPPIQGYVHLSPTLAQRDGALRAMLAALPVGQVDGRPGGDAHGRRPLVHLLDVADLPTDDQAVSALPRPWIAVADFAKLRQAVRLMQHGAADYLVRPVDAQTLERSLARAIVAAALAHDPASIDEQAPARADEPPPLGPSMIGGHAKMRRVQDLVAAVAPSRATVLLTGESGTGKSMIARLLHRQSDRRDQPMVTFACGALPENLLESELFGHVKGAFTDAQQDREGRLASADGGTLFIDEINSATWALQTKLLRVLQEREYEPVGSSTPRPCDVRFVLATNQDLGELIRQGRFREDLYYRINVVSIPMPALRERHGDIAALARHFVGIYAGELDRRRELTPETEAALEKYHWPGNVRELENAIERAVILSTQVRIGVDDLPEPVQTCWNGQAASSDPGPAQRAAQPGLYPRVDQNLTLEQAMRIPERFILLEALKRNDWNRRQTAEQLGIDRSTLYKKIKQHELFDAA